MPRYLSGIRSPKGIEKSWWDPRRGSIQHASVSLVSANGCGPVCVCRATARQSSTQTERPDLLSDFRVHVGCEIEQAKGQSNNGACNE